MIFVAPGSNVKVSNDWYELMIPPAREHDWITLQGRNISPKNGILKMIFLFPRWDMLIPWRVFSSLTSNVFQPMNFRYQQALRLLNEAIDFREKDGMWQLWQLSITEQICNYIGFYVHITVDATMYKSFPKNKTTIRPPEKNMYEPLRAAFWVWRMHSWGGCARSRVVDVGGKRKNRIMHLVKS